MRDFLPLWLRALDAAARVTERLARLASAIREETAIAWIPPDARASLTARVFDRERTYAPSGNIFKLGLFPWEIELLAPPFPARGRIIVGGAGGGREALALLERGYSVVAFDPASELVRAGEPALAAFGGVLRCASYEDVVRCARGDESALSDAFREPFDGVVLGWGSLSLVISDAERLSLFRALRTLAPRAPVLLTFDEPATGETTPGRARALLRRAYSRFGAPGYSGERMRYAPWAGVIRESAPDEVEAVVRAAGYEVAKRGSAPGRMLIIPVGDTPAAD